MIVLKENTNINENTFLNKKREKEFIQKQNKPNFDNHENHYHYHKNDKYNKFVPNINYHHFKYYPKGKYNYNRDYQNKSRYGHYNYQKKISYRWNENRIPDVRDYKKSYQNKFSGDIRNISNCDIFSPQSISLKEKDEENSWNSFPCSTNLNSPINSFNYKNLNKNIQDNQENVNNENEFKVSPNLENKEKQELKETKLEEMDKEEEDLLKTNKKIEKYKFFDRNEIKIKENPLKCFEIYPQNIFEYNMTKSTNKNDKNNIETENISLESCYLLSKIHNWRLVSKFVPVSSLKKENFEKIIEKIEENEEKKEKDKNKNMKEDIKSYLVYSEKYEEIIDGYLKENENKKKKIKCEIHNRKLISSQFQYDLLEIKNKIKKNKYELNFLNNQKDILCDAIDGNKILD